MHSPTLPRPGLWITLAVVAASLAALVLALVPSAAHAGGGADDDGIRLGIAPLDYEGGYFDIEMQPGETRTLLVEVSNHGLREVASRSYAADTYTISNGGAGIRLDGEPQTGATLWLEYEAQTVTLPSGSAVQREVIVSVPAGTQPGEYIASLVVQNADPILGEGDVAINQVIRTAIAVVVTVPGERLPSMAIHSVSHSYTGGISLLTFTAENTGNVRLKPAAAVSVTNQLGELVSSFAFALDSVYAGTMVAVEVPFAVRLNPGEYVASLTLTYEGGSVEFVDQPFAAEEPTEAEVLTGAPTGGSSAAVTQAPLPAEEGASLLLPLVGAVVLSILVAAAGVFLFRKLRRRDTPTPALPLGRQPAPAAGTGAPATAPPLARRLTHNLQSAPLRQPPLPPVPPAAPTSGASPPPAHRVPAARFRGQEPRR